MGNLFPALFFLVGLLSMSFLFTSVHEFSHLVAAKLTGIPVLRFRVWEGRPLLRFMLRGIEVLVGWKPIGGRVLVFTPETLARAQSEPDIRALVEARPELNEEFASRSYARYYKWAIFTFAGAGTEAVFAVCCGFLLLRGESSVPFVRGVQAAVLCHLGFSIGNLAPLYFPLRRQGLDGFYVVLYALLSIARSLGYEPSRQCTEKRLGISLLPFAVIYIAVLAKFWATYCGPVIPFIVRNVSGE